MKSPPLHIICLVLGIMGITGITAIAQTAPPVKSSLTAAKSSDIYKSVVRIEVATQTPSYKTPWNSGKFGGGTGTGFLIGKNKFLTNAHVVSNARRVLITMHGSARKHPARVLHIAHDCDLAVLEVEDFSPFNTLPHLEIGKVPQLETQVRVIGYPVGGDRISVTRGVVSRIDFRAYAHTRSDQHLVVQIDAAINPGNSGGPVLQGGKVVGVAFQGLTSADNTGYMIPTPVINHFLKDIEDGTYHQYVTLGVTKFPLFNPAMRKVYNLKQDDPGVLVARFYKDGPVDGILKEGDILTKVDGKSVDSAGSVEIDGERVNMSEIVERKFAADKVALTFIRDGKEQTAEVTLKHFPASAMYSIQYGKRPKFTIQGGLVFQPLSRNLYSALRLSNPRVRRLFAKYLTENIFKERKDIVILTKVLDDPINSYISGFTGSAIESINGVKITDMQQLHDLLNPETMPEFFVIRCDGLNRPLILPAKGIQKYNTRILETYGIDKASYLGK
ncbi:MAG: S1-C subfamily serine protease [Cryomorphaceae bacterium]|jgi:S1-C subfamily serine protease